MNPTEFAAKWSGSERTERAAAQEHFIDLCRMLGVETPNEADPQGTWYAFEKGAEKTGGGDGFADVWKKGHFAWEYKGKRKDLRAAYQQLLQYREALENPPLLVVSDLDRFEVHTNFTGTTKKVYAFALDDLATSPGEPLRILRAIMKEPGALAPATTRAQLTEAAAERFAALAKALRERGVNAHRVAHFLNKLLFCMFAQDVGLLPGGLIERLAENTRRHPEAFEAGLRDLFGKMAKSGGLFGVDRIEWFNGGLFDGDDVVPLDVRDIETVQAVSKLDWSDVEPAIFGTLFERGLDPGSRASLGAHYTDRGSIEQIVEPVVIAPLRREYDTMRGMIDALDPKSKHGAAATTARRKAEKVLDEFLDRLATVKVLDPACGSGNFLYVALQALKDLEHEAIVWASRALGTTGRLPRVGPQVLHGIELNDYAAELARVTIWIGEIQWMLDHGYGYRSNPVLQPLDTIECRDAILDHSDPSFPVEATWPDAEFIIGNPPFLGTKKLRAGLGDEYVEKLFGLYGDRIPNFSDLCCYWFEKARAMIAAGKAKRAGLLATQGIRGGENNRVLQRIKQTGDIFFAVGDQEWILDGAAVHVSMVGFDDGSEAVRRLDGRSVESIDPELSGGVSLVGARRLRENASIGFVGDVKSGPFDIPRELAEEFHQRPNPDGRSNAAVVRPWVNGLDVTRRPRDRWIIDFGSEVRLEEAALYEAPFGYVKEHVLPLRRAVKRKAYRERWWLHAEPCDAMRRATAHLRRYVATATVTKYRLFVWLDGSALPDHQLVVFARDDDYFLGVLQSSIHERWARSKGTQLREAESGCRYTPTTCFETYPFPPLAGGVARRASAGTAALCRERIARATQRLVALRGGWLDPISPDGKPLLQGPELSRRTLTNLYNERPTWLVQAHLDLDRAVLAAYGWPEEWAEGLQPQCGEDGIVNPALGVQDPAVEQELLAGLLALNRAASDAGPGRAAGDASPGGRRPRPAARRRRR